MKTILSPKLVAFISATALSLSLSATAMADSMSFHPVKSVQAAEKLKVGSQIAISCGNCGGVTIMTVDSDRSYLRSVKCPLCKKTFTQLAPGGGSRTSSVGSFSYTDAGGHTATLAAR